MRRTFLAQRVHQRRRLARQNCAAALVENLEGRIVLTSASAVATLAAPVMPSPGNSLATATPDASKHEGAEPSLRAIEAVAVRDAGPSDSSIVSAGPLLAVSGPVYSNLDEGSGYQPSAMTTGILGFDDYDSINDEDINLTAFRFVGGVTNAGDQLRFDFYDATYTDLVTSVVVEFPIAEILPWVVTVGSQPMIPDQGVLEVSTVDGAVGEWSASDAAPTIGTESGGFGSLSGSGLSHKFELTNSLPDPDDQISEAIGTSVGSSVMGDIDIPSDVDMYSFSAASGQRIAFDLDTPGSDLDTYVRLFNAAGTELSLNDDGNNAGPAPEDDLGDSYLEFTFFTGGTYYLGVSGFPNGFYDATNGGSDSEGFSTGTYTLTLSDVTPPPPTGDDFGDAPGPYPTLLADNGARHTLTGSTLFLGNNRDADAEGQPQPNALGDDNNGARDEDGVILTDLLRPGTTADVTVIASEGGGVLNAWFDWNRNGSWLDAGEQIFNDQPLSAGSNALSIPVPAAAELGLTMSRFRLSTASGLAPTGAAADGEVEDHQATVQTSGARINWVNRGQAADLFDSTFGAAANLARAVVDAVIASWERVITNFNQPGGGDQIDVAISMFASGTGRGAGTNVSSFNSGFPTAGSISIGRGLDITGDGKGDGGGYFLDPTPLDNSEFAGTLNQGAFTGNAQGGSPAAGLTDFFTLVNAEIAHVVGLFLSPALANSPLNGTVTDTGIADDAEGGSRGDYFVFDGPSVTHLFTSNNGGSSGSDFGELVHSAGPPNGPNQPLEFTSAFRGSGPLQLVGANDVGNAVYEFGRRYLANDVLALFFQDAYEYAITLPQTFGTMYTILNENTGELLIRGGLGGSADEFSLSVNGDELEVSVNVGNDIAGTGPNGDDSDIAAFVSRFPLADVTSVTIESGDGSDLFTVAPLPGIPITIDGGTPAFPNGGVGDELAFDVTGFTTGTFLDNGDGSGSLSDAAFGTVTWNEIEIVMPPAFLTPVTVTGTSINGGGNSNRSGIRELTFSFSDAVTIDGAAALRLFDHTTGLPVDLSNATLVGNGTASVTWDLSGVALDDGRYSAELPADAATPGLAATHAFAFHKLAGDANGDGAVSNSDYREVNAHFGSITGGAFRPGDANGDGVVSNSDYREVNGRFGTVLATLSLDFGDAPGAAAFPTTLAEDGARHVLTANNLFLGASRDAETDGQSSADAGGDDAAGMDDENGLTIGDLERGSTVSVTVTANVPAGAVLNGWIDWNADGDWDDAGEQVFTNVPLSSGPNDLDIEVPAAATPGPTTARFRLTQTPGYSYFGLAPNGEVEDYQVAVTAPPPQPITIDGDFSDWALVPAYADPADDQHDTDHDQPGDTPAYVDHPDVDLLTYKVSHDAENFYFYFQATGEIGRTQMEDVANGLRAGRYYVIVTIDIDQDDVTGYPLYEGGYYTGTTSTTGYDVNAEIEFYNGAVNTGHYLQHGATSEGELEQAFADQSGALYDYGGPETQGPFLPGFVNVLPGSYDYYTQWVYKDNDPNLGGNDSITFVQDKGPVVLGNLTHARSADGHQLEMKVPFEGFLTDAEGNPLVTIGQTVDISFSLEASGELSNEVSPQQPNGLWASDTAEPINGYYLSPVTLSTISPAVVPLITSKQSPAVGTTSDSQVQRGPISATDPLTIPLTGSLLSNFMPEPTFQPFFLRERPDSPTRAASNDSPVNFSLIRAAQPRIKVLVADGDALEEEAPAESPSKGKLSPLLRLGRRLVLP